MKRVSREARIAQAEACLASGMLVRDWCAENGVAAPTMYAWARRQREEREIGLAPAFVEVGDGPGARRAPSGVPIVARVGGVDVLVPAGADARDVETVMRAAAAL